MNIPLRMLMIEDSDDDARLVLDELKRGGYEPVCERVETQTALEAALARLTFEVVIADFSLPRFTGLAALRIIQSQGLDIPFIVVSGTIGEEFAVELMKAGANDYVMKRDLHRLAPAVRRELREADGRRERRRAEAALRRSEELFHAIVEDQTEMIARWKPDGTLTFVNQACCRAFNRSYDKLVGSSFYPLATEEHREAIQRNVRSLTPASPLSTSIRESVSPSGVRLWQEWTDRGLFDAGGRLVEVQSTGRDITERRNAELHIEHLNRVYAVLSDINQAIVRLKDTQTMLATACDVAVKKGKFCLAWVSLSDPPGSPPKLAAHAGLAADTLAILSDLLGNDLDSNRCAFVADAMRTGQHSICHDIEQDPQTAAWREVALRQGYRTMASLPLKLGDQVVGTFNLYAAEPGFFNEAELRLLDELSMDISFALEVSRTETERQHGVAALRESEERFRLLAEHIDDVFWITDAAKQHMFYISPAYETIWGRSCDSLYRSPQQWLNAIHAEDRERILQAALAKQVAGTYDEEYRIHRPSGTIRWVRDRAFPVPETDGQVRRIVGVVQDITERKQLEEQLRQAQKMEAIGQLAGGIAHDFNNILGAIMGNLELARLFPTGDPRIEESLSSILSASRRAADLVRQILAFSRRQEAKRKPMQLHVVVKEVLTLLRASMPAAVEFHADIASTPSVLADPSEIHQVTMNLCTNAWHALEGRPGIIKVELAEVAVDANLARVHPELRPGRYVRLAVVDRGCGMDRATVERIFEPFFTTKPVGVGTGLGLAVVHGIMKNHDGGIVVQSQPGKGTTFHLYFPVFEGEHEVAAVQRAPLQVGHAEHVLFVDDEEPLTKMGRAVLDRLGYRTTPCTNPLEALELFAAKPDAFDLVITDLNMPHLSGTDLARKLLAIRPDLRIILTTGFSATLTAEVAHDMGIGELLSKPYDIQSLSESVRRMLASPKATR